MQQGITFLFMDAKLEFAERLSEAMKKGGYVPRPAVLEREFNTRYWGRPMTMQGVRRWLRGEAIPPPDKMNVLAEWLKVEPEVLLFGEEARKSIQTYRQQWEGVDAVEREAFDAFLQLPAPQRKLVREVILTFAQVHGKARE